MHLHLYKWSVRQYNISVVLFLIDRGTCNQFLDCFDVEATVKFNGWFKTNLQSVDVDNS